MDFETFRSGSLLHVLCLVAVLAAVVMYAWIGRKHRQGPAVRVLRWIIGMGCLTAWLLNTVYWIWPSRFHWEQALPLHYCNMANVIGALAIWTGRRLLQALLYFWALALCTWALITPTVRYGPASADFWVFWWYHGFIALAVTHLLIVDRFRPALRDLPGAVGFTLLYTLGLVAINNVWGWNYGFVGPSTPESVTLIDVLGPYPARLLWIFLLALTLFFLCLLPWIWGERRRRRAGRG